MKVFRILLLVFCATATAQNLTNAAIFGGDFDPNRLESYRSMNDGRHFTVLETDKDDESSRLIKYAYLDGKRKRYYWLHPILFHISPPIVFQKTKIKS